MLLLKKFHLIGSDCLKKVAVIQDMSSFGKCSLTAAIPVLSVMGVQACPLPTAVFSAQTAYPSFHHQDLTANMPHFMNEWARNGETFDARRLHHHNQQQQQQQQQQHKQTQLRKSPQKFGPTMNGALPQIDESNSLTDGCYGSSSQTSNSKNNTALNTSTLANGNRNATTNGRPQIVTTKSPIHGSIRGQHIERATTGRSPTVSSATSSASSSPTSSRASSNSSPSSSSSVDFLSASKMLNRSAASRHSTTELNRRQFSVEREVSGQSPMTAKLSRVGSCRGYTHQQQASRLIPSQQQIVSTMPIAINGLPSPQSLVDSQNFLAPACGQSQRHLLLNPAISHQPPMKTSKILNIGSGQQQQQATGTSRNSSPCKNLTGAVGSSSSSSNVAESSPSGSRYRQLNQLAENLAEIRLNDSLAFSSLRAPKKSSSGSNLLLNKSIDSQRNLVNSASKSYRLGGNNSPLNKQQQQQQNQRPLSANGAKGANDGNNNNNLGQTNHVQGKPPPSANNNNPTAGSSSVWFEYGCV